MQDGETPLHVAAAYGKGDVAQWLLVEQAMAKDEKGGSTETEKERLLERGTPLHLAATHGHLDVVKVLIEAYGRLKELGLKCSAGG